MRLLVTGIREDQVGCKTVCLVLLKDVPVPQTQEQIGEVVQVIPRERVSECIWEQIVDIPAPHILERKL